MKAPALAEVEYHSYTRPVNPQAMRDDEWTLFYSAGGSCEFLIDGHFLYRIPARHLLLFDVPHSGEFRVESSGTLLCHHFVFRGMKEKLAAWTKQFASQNGIITFLRGHTDGLLLVDTENENIYGTLSEIAKNRFVSNPYQELFHQQLMTLLLLKLARSLQAHYCATGVYYIKKAKQFIIARADAALPIQRIADEVGIHRSYLQMLFKKHTGHSITEYINHVRIGKSMLLLTTTNQPVVDISLATGFNSRQHFTRTFLKYVGCPPSEYRQLHSLANIENIQSPIAPDTEKPAAVT